MGSERTDPEFLANIFSPCLGSAQCNLQIPQVLQNLERLDIFYVCRPLMSQPSSVTGSTLAFETKERKVRIYSGADIKTSLSWIFNLELYNIFCKAEKLKLESSFGRNISKPFEISFIKPLNPNARCFDNFKFGCSFQNMLFKHRFTEKISSIYAGLFSPTQSLWLDFRIKGFSAQESQKVTPEIRKRVLGQFPSISLIHENVFNFYSTVSRLRNVLTTFMHCLGTEQELHEI